jgi:hypothetical protein
VIALSLRVAGQEVRCKRVFLATVTALSVSMMSSKRVFFATVTALSVSMMSSKRVFLATVIALCQ